MDTHQHSIHLFEVALKTGNGQDIEVEQLSLGQEKTGHQKTITTTTATVSYSHV